VKKYLQTIIDSKKGDCLEACIRCLLEDESVPPFKDGIHDWYYMANEWLSRYNLQLGFVGYGAMPLPRGNFIFCVKSALFEGTTHAVIARENPETGLPEVIWNPNPQDPRGINIDPKQGSHIYLLIVLDPSKLKYGL